MQIINKIIEVQTGSGIGIYNITPQLLQLLEASGIKNGQLLVFSRHTTTALAINENEERLLVDIKAHLEKLAPCSGTYLHGGPALERCAPGRTGECPLSLDGSDAQQQ
jgi:secondary thiamine-phosphate synthase enzyme